MATVTLTTSQLMRSSMSAPAIVVGCARSHVRGWVGGACARGAVNCVGGAVPSTTPTHSCSSRDGGGTRGDGASRREALEQARVERGAPTTNNERSGAGRSVIYAHCASSLCRLASGRPVRENNRHDRPHARTVAFKNASSLITTTRRLILVPCPLL